MAKICIHQHFLIGNGQLLETHRVRFFTCPIINLINPSVSLDTYDVRGLSDYPHKRSRLLVRGLALYNPQIKRLFEDCDVNALYFFKWINM